MNKKIYDEDKVIEMLYNKTQKEVGEIFGISQKKHFIKTHALRGISKRDVEKAIKILNN